MKITHLPGKKPVIDYRIGANGGTVAEGASVPYGTLTEQFNSQLGAHGPAATPCPRSAPSASR